MRDGMRARAAPAERGDTQSEGRELETPLDRGLRRASCVVGVEHACSYFTYFSVTLTIK